MSYRIRPAIDSDADLIAEIWHVGWIDGHLGHVSDELVAERSRASFDSRTPERIAETTVAASPQGKVAGFIMVVDDEVEQVYVSADHRGTGVSDLLLDEAERQVAAAGHPVAWLAVVAGNARARRFYEKRGWANAGPLDYGAADGDGAKATVTVEALRYEKAVGSAVA